MDSKLLDYLHRLKQYGVKNQIPNVTPQVGQFLNMLIRIRRPERILEIGSANGYSTLWMAEAARSVGARITSIDYSKPTFGECQKNIAETGFDDVVELVFGNALELLPEMEEVKFDMVFVDGRKSSYLDFWKAVQPLLTEHPIAVFDDMLAFPYKTGSLMKALEKQTEYDMILLPIDKNDGIVLLNK